MTIVALPEPVRTELAYTLRRAADRLAGLPHARVSAVDLERALLDSAPSYWEAQAARDTLYAHLRSRGEDARWLIVGGSVQGRVRAAEQLRAAAERETPAAVTR